jgi:hypothetical protein
VGTTYVAASVAVEYTVGVVSHAASASLADDRQNKEVRKSEMNKEIKNLL